MKCLRSQVRVWWAPTLLSIREYQQSTGPVSKFSHRLVALSVVMLRGQILQAINYIYVHNHVLDILIFWLMIASAWWSQSKDKTTRQNSPYALLLKFFQSINHEHTCSTLPISSRKKKKMTYHPLHYTCLLISHGVMNISMGNKWYKR